MSENKVSVVTYTKDQHTIVKDGVNAISEILNGTNTSDKRSLLLCLDKYLDPYYGYNLPYFDDIIFLLQKQLFLNDDTEVKEDILQLLSDYSKGSLSYLADNIEEMEPELLADALYALANTYNCGYVPIFIRYENHHNPAVRNVAQEALQELSKSNINLHE
ncbi:MAG: hypothetical protein K0R93_1663 [Anaerosolibacter sp.]|jgi:hypothetical protein|uniref:hypothetical protein n=1 Tax=Anaerosolibacter sp. TaxID=1872527 RepID=UPI0026360EBB|nr:hypothetical protein [Anaerosolibacter sp.]MDF2546765.1 hypothetical protein [Anaerosolibacter sp.]